MKKIIAAVLLTLLALSVCTFALAEDVLLSSRDLTVALEGMEIAYLTGKDGSQTPYLSCNLTIENNTGTMIDFQGGSCTVNGIQTDILTPSRVKTGTVQTDIMLMAADGNADHLYACEAVDFDLAVYTYDTEELLYKFPVHIEGEISAEDQAAPAPAAEGAIDIISSSDLTVTITGAKMAGGDSGALLQCTLQVNNGMGHKLAFSGSNCVINGVETKVGMPARADAGVSETFLIFMPKDGQSADYLRDIDSLTFDLQVRNAENNEVVCDVPVYIGGDLPGMAQEAVPAQQESEPAAESEPVEEKTQAPEGAMEPYMEDDALVIAHDLDFSVRIGGWEMAGSDPVVMRLYPVIENRSGRTLDFWVEDAVFDGVEVEGFGAYNVENGTCADDFFMFKDENDATGQRMYRSDRISFKLVVKDDETFDVVAEIPVVLTREWLNMIYEGDTRTDAPASAAQDQEEAGQALGVFEPYMENDTLVLMANEYLCLRLSGWEANLREDGVTTRIYPIIENRTVRTLDFRLEDAYFDDNPVDGYGIYDVESGVCADDFFMFKDPNGSAGYELLEPDQISFKLVVRDSDNSSKILTEAYMSISGEWLDMLYEGDPRDMHADYAYEYGEDEEYYEYTAPEDPCPLEIFEGAYIEWENLSGDQLKIRVQVLNSSWNLSVESFRINMYADDLWGNCLWEEDLVYYEVTDRYIGPGTTAYSDYFYVPDRDEIGKVYFGISDVYCTNGREYHISDVEYWSWNLT